ncbi:serine hydrolase domain-containing protein [Sutcliffiella rhizosphaerae]|uniref:D-alanyl-D-alanine carboxypeptidase n=1 Tax=Sutcliffiella rhizosphaerae TaxID=2880967 RepID=A0ABN8A6I5_9BACI|nr:serine hydrolase domain-containing protein [Sutcliffiella rhizosphaerae]CAG9620006.1 Putative D-alanyl-D-alanine carboxypeptidase [Sutcliffiella rhizosphaerae]
MYKEYLHQLITNQDLPGAVLYIKKGEKLICHEAFGSYIGADHQTYQMTKNTLFDIASLTKVMVTLPACLYLVAKGELSLNRKILYYLPKFKHKEVTVEHLLTHRSGLPADLSYKARSQDQDVMSEIYQAELVQPRGQIVAYSDLGMILLGKIIEQVSDQSLDSFINEHLFTPWGINHSYFNPSDELKALAAATEEYETTFIQGEVHDEKAFHLGGVSGSAGLFSTAADVAQFARYFLYPDEQKAIRSDLIKLATKHVQSNRGLGFEVWNGEGDPLSCGALWPVGSFGHTGFTGTSIWVSPKDELVVVFLSNAVHFGRSLKIRTIRKELHSLIYSSLFGEIS